MRCFLGRAWDRTASGRQTHHREANTVIRSSQLLAIHDKYVTTFLWFLENGTAGCNCFARIIEPIPSALAKSCSLPIVLSGSLFSRGTAKTLR